MHAQRPHRQQGHLSDVRNVCLVTDSSSNLFPTKEALAASQGFFCGGPEFPPIRSERIRMKPSIG